MNSHDCNLYRICIDSRYVPAYGYHRRRFKCDECAERWSTIEVIVHSRSKNLKKVLAKELGKSFIPPRHIATMNSFVAAIKHVKEAL